MIRTSTYAGLLTVVGLTIMGTNSMAKGAQLANTVRGFAITYPDNWSGHVVRDGHQVILSSYPWKQHPKSVLVKPGGAVILVNVFPPYFAAFFPAGTDDSTALLARSGHDVIISQQAPSDKSLARITRVDDTYRFSETIRHIGSLTFLVTLEYERGNQRAATYEQTLDDVIGGIALTNTKHPPKYAH